MNWEIDHGDVLVALGDARERLADLDAGSVHAVVTSPPFFALRDYSHADQIGLEATPEEFIAELVRVFSEAKRVLRDDGSMWIEIGDSYAKKNYPGIRSKNLIGIPWMLAFALRADGWYIRAENIWDKPNAMPESTRDRMTRAHSQILMLTKRDRYFFDSDAVRTPHKEDGRKVTRVVGREGSAQHRNGERWPGAGANARSVWHIATENNSAGHFAIMAQAVVERCIKAATSEHGCCGRCGAPWSRMIETPGESLAERMERASRDHDPGRPDMAYQHMGREMTPPGGKPRETIGWEPTCDCGCGVVDPCVVLDPFMGFGTTALVARKLSRRSVGIEVNPETIELMRTRLGQQSLLT